MQGLQAGGQVAPGLGGKMREGREMQEDKFRVQLAMECKAIDNTRGRALQCRQENDRQIDYQRGTATMLEHKTSPRTCVLVFGEEFSPSRAVSPDPLHRCSLIPAPSLLPSGPAQRLREEERQAQEADEKLAAIERLKEQTVDQIREVAAHQAQPPDCDGEISYTIFSETLYDPPSLHTLEKSWSAFC
ncbi:hypothetical protein PAPYR_1415 [Paratrimastix pyriformis]|uniref:Uncharacterized protein n=1 Tax=Paratrimastix pyriformis TaxID=342808 RepID=A0ABQ8UZJ3_9EUKA|nr:hypothetical protein PAPYR_1415 [Paratrimastix pyriformis]